MANKKTRYPGVEKLSGGRFYVRVSARHPVTGTKKFKEATLEGVTLDEAVAERARMKTEFKQELAGEKEALRRVQDAFQEIITVADYAELWTERRVSRLKPRWIGEISSCGFSISGAEGQVGGPFVRRFRLELAVSRDLGRGSGAPTGETPGGGG